MITKLFSKINKLSFYAVLFLVSFVFAYLFIQLSQYTKEKKKEAKTEVFTDFTADNKKDVLEEIKEIKEDESYIDNNDYNVTYGTGVFFKMPKTP